MACKITSDRAGGTSHGSGNPPAFDLSAGFTASSNPPKPKTFDELAQRVLDHGFCGGIEETAFILRHMNYKIEAGSDRIRGYVKEYGDAPIWTAVETLPFGTLSKLFCNTRPKEVTHSVADSLGVRLDDLVRLAGTGQSDRLHIEGQNGVLSRHGGATRNPERKKTQVNLRFARPRNA